MRSLWKDPVHIAHVFEGSELLLLVDLLEVELVGLEYERDVNKVISDKIYDIQVMIDKYQGYIDKYL
jgi:hypothetical protein